jgi:hypothetical protein
MQAICGRPLLQIAGALGILPSMLRRWHDRREGLKVPAR